MQSLIRPRCPPGPLPAHSFSDDQQLHAKLLAIALDELPKLKALRRGELARRDYKPEPVAVLLAPKKSWLKGLLRILRRLWWPAVILALVTLILFDIKASNDWFDAHFAYGVEKTRDRPFPAVVGDVILDERLPDGRTITVRYKGHAPSKSELPSVEGSELGDMWYTQDDGSCWVLAPLSATNPTKGWVDP
jgi:hypothetical protein